MQIPVLIELLENGRFRARAGEPFTASTEADSAEDARQQLERVLRQRLQHGAAAATVELRNGAPEASPSPAIVEPVPDDDWFFQTMREAIEENRRREDETA